MDSRRFLTFSLCFLSVLTAFARLPESHLHNALTGSVLRFNGDISPLVFDPTRVTQLSWQPRAFLYKRLLSDVECDHLIVLAKDKLEKSMVADNESGKSVSSEVRTSSGMFLQKAQDEIVAGIEARISAWTFLPVENGESIQILHYENGQKYEPHFDFFHDKVNQELGGHRIATVLMYLSNVEKGGETIFPNSELAESQEKDDSWSDCARKGYAVKAQKGDALLFFSLHPDATTDTRSLHGSCPVIEGEKWSATKWIHVRSFEKATRTHASKGCVDEDESCPSWAERASSTVAFEMVQTRKRLQKWYHPMAEEWHHSSEGELPRYPIDNSIHINTMRLKSYRRWQGSRGLLIIVPTKPQNLQLGIGESGRTHGSLD